MPALLLQLHGFEGLGPVLGEANVGDPAVTQREDESRTRGHLKAVPASLVDDAGHNDRVAHRRIRLRLDPARVEDLVVLGIEAQGLLDSAVETRSHPFEAVQSSSSSGLFKRRNAST